MNKNINIKNDNSLPENLHYILIGLMLGDGYISKSSPTSNSRFEGTKYKEFALSIGQLFEDYMSNPVKGVEVKGKKATYINYRLKTASLPVFNPYYDMFYRLNSSLERPHKFVKFVPLNIYDNFNSIVLAYLLMSDGNFDKNRNRVRIYTNSFTKEEVKKLAEIINTKLNIYTGVLHDRKDQWILTIGQKQLESLRNIVKPHFVSSMYYRIGL